MTGGPLDGVRVLDFTRLLPGPLCTMFLGDLGADVIKIEDTEHGDYIRRIGPMTGENSARFHVLNRNKRSLGLDYRSAAGRDVVLRLAREADVLIEGFRPGAMAETSRRSTHGWSTARCRVSGRPAPIAPAPATT
jgi:crotonobetainyl-CoA:carnitine CoA-transferase CaiB-like acyl-CoA transferase